MRSKAAIRVLHLESDAGDLAFVSRALAHGRETFSISQTSSIAEAEKRLHAGDYDVVLLEPELDGETVDVFEFVRARPTIPTVLLTSEISAQRASRALQAGAHDVLEKGEVSGAALRRSLASAIQRHRGLDRLSLQPAPGTVVQCVEDLRNVLTVALVNLQTVRKQLDPGSSLVGLCEKAEGAIRRAAEVTADLERDHGDGSPPERRP